MTLPGFHECPECGGSGRMADTSKALPDVSAVYPIVACPKCGGAGQVPDDGTVEAVAPQIHANDPAYSPPYWDDCYPEMKKWYRTQTRFALLAYARHTQETKP